MVADAAHIAVARKAVKVAGALGLVAKFQGVACAVLDLRVYRRILAFLGHRRTFRDEVALARGRLASIVQAVP